VIPKTDSLPEPQDLPAAKALITSLQEQLLKSQREIASLKHQLDVLCRRLFGKKSEKVDPRQLQLAMEQLQNELTGEVGDPVEMDSCEPVLVRERLRKPPRGRRPLPGHLPRRVVLVDVPEEEKVCSCGTAKEKIGEAVSEKLDYLPSQFEVVKTVRPKYACPQCHEGVTSAPCPAQAVEKGLAAEGLLAQVVVSKYVDHLPLYRQERIFGRVGVDLPRSTLVGFVEEASEALSPVGEELKREVLKANYLQTDDTPVVVLADLGGSFKGRLWTYLDPLSSQVIFEATRTHERDGPAKFLEGFQGFLQADAYKGYDVLYRSGGIVEVGCWAHGRRRFVEALDTDIRGAPIVASIQQLYQVEREGEGIDYEGRRVLRQERSVPLLAQIDSQRKALEKDVLPKSPLGDALRYIENQWKALNRFVEDGRLRIDNNGAENQLRAVALGRKNWLFAGSMAGLHRAALLYSLAQSCRLVGVEPFAYFRDVLLRVATHPQSAIGQLTPKGWAATFAIQSQSTAVPA
jgi:transposase